MIRFLLDASRLLALLLTCFALPGASRGDEPTPVVRTETLRIHGKVSDLEGEPIQGAKIHIIGVNGRHSLRQAFAGSQSVQSGTDGDFSIEFSKSDHRFRQSEHVLVVAEFREMRTAVFQWGHGRTQAGQPMTIKLARQDPMLLRVVDSEGSPLQGVQLSAARIGPNEIPFQAWASQNHRTDEQGRVELPGFSKSTLRMVYATSPSIGNQCLPVDVAADGSAEVVLLDTSPEVAQLSINEGELPTNLDALAVTLFSKVGESDDSPYTWWQTKFDEDGTARDCLLSGGTLQFRTEFPAEFPFVVDRTAAARTTRPPPGEPINVELVPGTRVVGKIIRSDNGEPIPDIYIHHFDYTGRDCFTNQKGLFEFWAGRDRIGYYPFDVYENFLLAGAFYLYPQELPVDGLLELDPVQLQPCSSAVGTVVDQAGNPVAGAEVTCIYKKERFTYEQSYYTDSQGNFRFLGVTDGTGVSLTAKTDTRIASEPVSLLLEPDSQPRIEIQPRYGVRLRGRVVDYRGVPIQGATVRVRISKTHQKEAYSGRDGHFVDVLGVNEMIETDADGRFTSPPILDWEQEVAIAVDAPGQRALHTYLIDLRKSGETEENYDFGDLTMRPKAIEQQFSVQVLDETSGESIVHARVVALGARTPRTAATTNDSGSAVLSIPDGLQLLGVNAEGYLPKIEIMRAVGAKRIVRLRPASASPPERQPADIEQDRLKALAQALVARLAEPDATESFNRRRCYAYCLAFADFDQAITKLKAESGLIDKQLLGPYIASLDWLDLVQQESLLEFTDPRSRSMVLLRMGERTEDVAEREELVGEALVLARQLQGDDHAYAIATIAESLLNTGDSELAKSLLAEAWEEHGELADVLAQGERVKKPGIARLFAPPYALVDPDAALKLIELCAYADEVERLQTKAMVYLGLFEPERFDHQWKKRGLQQLSSLGITQFYGKLVVRDLQRGLRIADCVPPSPGKAQFLLELMKNARDASEGERLAVARSLLETLMDRSPEASMVNTSDVAAKAAVMVKPWDAGLAEEFVFESLWLCEHETTILPFNLTSRLASELARYDHDLARALVEPCFEDWSWLFNSRDASVIFVRNMPLSAAVSIDPTWAAELTSQLFEDHLASHPSRQYETAYGLVERCGELAKP